MQVYPGTCKLYIGRLVFSLFEVTPVFAAPSAFAGELSWCAVILSHSDGGVLEAEHEHGLCLEVHCHGGGGKICLFHCLDYCFNGYTLNEIISPPSCR